MSIQRAAIWLLEQYYKDFVVYNPWLENIHRKKGVQMLQFEQGTNKKSKLVNPKLNSRAFEFLCFLFKIS